MAGRVGVGVIFSASRCISASSSFPHRLCPITRHERVGVGKKRHLPWPLLESFPFGQSLASFARIPPLPGLATTATLSSFLGCLCIAPRRRSPLLQCLPLLPSLRASSFVVLFLASLCALLMGGFCAVSFVFSTVCAIWHGPIEKLSGTSFRRRVFLRRLRDVRASPSLPPCLPRFLLSGEGRTRSRVPITRQREESRRVFGPAAVKSGDAHGTGPAPPFLLFCLPNDRSFPRCSRASNPLICPFFPSPLPHPSSPTRGPHCCDPPSHRSPSATTRLSRVISTLPFFSSSPGRVSARPSLE